MGDAACKHRVPQAIIFSTGMYINLQANNLCVQKHSIVLRVRGNDQKFSGAEVVDQINDGLLCRGVQSGKWFIHEDDLRRSEDCAENGETPLHPAGEFADRFFECICREEAEKKSMESFF